MAMCRSLRCTPFKGNTPAVVCTSLQQHHTIPWSFRRCHLAPTCSRSNSRQWSSKICHVSTHTTGGRLGFIGSLPITLNRRSTASAAASDSGSAAGTRSTAYSTASSTAGNIAGNTAGSTSGNSAGTTPGSTAGSTPSSTAGSKEGSAASSTPSSTPGSTPGNAVGSTPGTTSGITPGSTPSSTAGSTAGSTPGSTAGTPVTSDPRSSTKGPGGGLARMLQKWNQDSKQLRQQLQSLGLAGVVAYGLFNTAYYTVAFLFVWFTVANVPAGLGLQTAARKAAEVFALVWAGSQVTKLLRAGGALAFAPVVDQGLNWAVGKFRMNSKQQAFWLVVVACSLLAAAVFGFVVVVHA